MLITRHCSEQKQKQSINVVAQYICAVFTQNQMLNYKPKGEMDEGCPKKFLIAQFKIRLPEAGTINHGLTPDDSVITSLHTHISRLLIG